MLIDGLARTAVHFQDVLERYSPYETLLEISSAEGLNDTSLAAAFPLHTATPAALSPAGRLGEISEDAEDGGPSQKPSSNSYFSSKRYKPDRRADQATRSEQSLPPLIQVNGDGVPTHSLSSPLASPRKTSMAQYLVRDDSGHRSVTSLGTSTLASTIQDTGSEISMKSSESVASTVEPSQPLSINKPLPSQPPQEVSLPRASKTESTTAETRKSPDLSDRPLTERALTSPASEREAVPGRPTYDDDLYDFSRFEPKPKVKLAPRPVTAAERAKRPTVASVSSVPATYKPSFRKQEPPARPTSQGPPTAATPHFLPAPPPIPDIPDTYSPRPVSRGSVKSLPSHRSTAMTPDKLRLMKAVELRRKQMRKSNPQAEAFEPPKVEDVPAVPARSTIPYKQAVERTPEKNFQPEDAVQELKQSSSKKPDSGISMSYDNPESHQMQNGIDEARPKESAPTAGEPEHPPTESLPRSQKQHSPKVDTLRSSSSQQTPNQAARVPPDSPINAQQRDDEKQRHASPRGTLSLAQTHDGLGITTPRQENSITVPNIVMADGTRPLSSTAPHLTAGELSPAESDQEAKSADEASSTPSMLEPTGDTLRKKNSDVERRRRGFVEPLHNDPGAELSSDEEFMEELQTATLQEARPIMVAKSPIAAYFPRRPSANSVLSDNSPKLVQTATRGSAMTPDFADMHDRLSPDPSFDYYGHSQFAPTPPQEKSDPMASMSRKVSNGINKRIQALAERSSREYTPELRAFIMPEAVNSPIHKDQRPPSSRNSSFKAVSRHNRMSATQNQAVASSNRSSGTTPVYNVQHDSANARDSVSVTARIVRPSTREQTDTTEGDEERLQQSQLVINHNRITPAQAIVPQLHRLDTTPAALKPESVGSRGNSPTMVRASTDGTRQLHSASRFGRHRTPISPTVDDFPPPPSHRANSLTYNDENSAPKEGTRTSRFFKRMSNLGGKRTSIAQQSLGSSSASERGSVAVHNPTLPTSRDSSDMPPAVVVGDLNIQFPDSLVRDTTKA